MAHAVRHSFPQQVGKQTKRTKKQSYLDWIKTLPCVITGVTNRVEAAHVSYAVKEWGAPGRGKGRKVSDRWALPLCGMEHHIQHHMAKSESGYWRSRRINPHALCCALYGHWNERGDQDDETAIAIIRSARNL